MTDFSEDTILAFRYGDFHAIQRICELGKEDFVASLLKDNLQISDKSQWKLFHKACKNNYRQMAKTLLDKWNGVNVADPHGSTPLHYACASGNEYMVRLLIKGHLHTRIKNAIFSPKNPFSSESKIGTVFQF